MLYRDYCIHRGVRGHDATWVAPFGDLGIIARWQLPQAFRSLLRPSSPVVPRYPPVCSYVLTKTRSRNTFLKLQSMLCAWTRSHVWHMKVLLYAVFKVRVRDSPARRHPHLFEKSGCSELRAAPSKLNSAVPTNDSSLNRSSCGRPSCEGRATEAENGFGLVLLIRTLARTGRANPESRASSVVDLECPPLHSR